MVIVNYQGSEYKITRDYEWGKYRVYNTSTGREYFVNPEKPGCTCRGFVYNNNCRHLKMAREAEDKIRSSQRLEDFNQGKKERNEEEETTREDERGESESKGKSKVIFLERKGTRGSESPQESPKQSLQESPLVEAVDQEQLAPVHEPVMSEEAALKLFNRAEDLAKSLLEQGKHVLFIGDRGVPVDPKKEHSRPYVTSQGWMRIARVFGVRTDIVSIEREDEKSGHFSYRVTVRAYKGRCNDVDVGIVSSRDKLYSKGGRVKPEDIDPKNVCLKAVTQAKGRAIRSFFAFTEPTAEEMI